MAAVGALYAGALCRHFKCPLSFFPAHCFETRGSSLGVVVSVFCRESGAAAVALRSKHFFFFSYRHSDGKKGIWRFVSSDILHTMQRLASQPNRAFRAKKKKSARRTKHGHYNLRHMATRPLGFHAWPQRPRNRQQGESAVIRALVGKESVEAVLAVALDHAGDAYTISTQIPHKWCANGTQTVRKSCTIFE